MKKYIWRYIFIGILIIILFLTRDIQPKIFIGELSDYIDGGLSNSLNGNYQVLLVNTCFVFILSIATILTTISKQNKVKHKYIIATILFIALFCILPFIKQTYFGGINESAGEQFFSIISYIIHIFG